MPKLTINGTEVEVEKGTSVLQACEQLGLEIPRFCFHDRLSVPANCRMCLVEMVGAPKPIASCAMSAADGMQITTNSDRIVNARKGVMEMLLVNHPLDCPICDQGGECDLQDQAVGYGYDRGRYNEQKRAVTDKYLGPLVKTVMTRCIHCTRCVRFSDEIAGVPEMGEIGRGEHTEIGNYIENAIHSELSGNLVDVCPVGALTSKPYAFHARPWELRKTQSIDVLDAVGANIRVDARGGEVMRILPRLHEGVNEEWLGDRSRYALDGLTRNRLDRPYVRQNGKLVAADWNSALAAAHNALVQAGVKAAAVAGDQADSETLFLVKEFLASIGSTAVECRQDGALFDVSQPTGWLFNPTIAGIEKADVVLIVASNPRWEATLLNARIRKAWMNGHVEIAVIGPKLDLTYPYEYLGEGPEALDTLMRARSGFAKKLKSAQRPMILVGMGAFCRADGLALHGKLSDFSYQSNVIRDDWNGFGVIHTAANRVGALALGYGQHFADDGIAGLLAQTRNGGIKTLYLVEADEINPDQIGKDCFVIYQGHHGGKMAARADVILPGSAYTEKTAFYVNLEGRVQSTRQAVFPPGEAREDWKIVRALSGIGNQPLPYDQLVQIRRKLAEINPFFARIDAPYAAPAAKFGGEGSVSSDSFVSPITNYYQSCAITRSSPTMAQCVEEILTTTPTKRTGTNG
jgi:NADH-quinone oxidoreductase subunit G